MPSTGHANGDHSTVMREEQGKLKAMPHLSTNPASEDLPQCDPSVPEVMPLCPSAELLWEEMGQSPAWGDKNIITALVLL